MSWVLCACAPYWQYLQLQCLLLLVVLIACPTGWDSADASKAFPLRFGSISPGFMNGMQVGTTHTHSHAFHANYMLVVFNWLLASFSRCLCYIKIPAPTSSAPSNWDERKLYQVWLYTFLSPSNWCCAKLLVVQLWDRKQGKPSWSDDLYVSVWKDCYTRLFAAFLVRITLCRIRPAKMLHQFFWVWGNSLSNCCY